MLPDIHLKNKCDNINKLIVPVLVGVKLIGGWQIIRIDKMKTHEMELMQTSKKQQQLELPQY